MKLKNSELMELDNGLVELKALRITDESTSWKIARISRKIRDDIEAINERVNELVKKYVEHGDNCHPVIIYTPDGKSGNYAFKKMEQKNSYLEDRKTLYNETVEIDLPTILDVKITGGEITPSIREKILPIIEFKEDKK